MEESLNKFQPLRHLLSCLLALGCLQLLFKLGDERVQIDFLENIADGLGPHLGNKGVAKLLLRLAVLSLREQLLRLEGGLALINDKVILVVNHPLQIPCGHVHHQSQAARHALVEPDVAHRHGQLDMTHPLATHPCKGDLDPATVANHPFELDPLVFSAGTLVVLRRPEDPLAKQPTLFRLEGPVVDRFRIFGFSAAPGENRFGRSHRDADFVKTYASLHS